MSQSTPFGMTHESAGISGEAANQWTHAFGWCLSLVGAVVLIKSAGMVNDGWRMLGCWVYAVSLVGVYGASTLSHAVTEARWRNRFRMLDQICIFLLVVGTYTAYATSYAREGWPGLMLALMWAIALVGIITRIRSGEESVSFLWYVALGWIPVVALGHMLETTGIAGVSLAIGGGLAYTGGTYFLANDGKHPYFHAVWHCFTILGSLLHFIYVYEFVAAAPLG